MGVSDIRGEMGRRVLVLDGAMGTMIQRLGLTEADYHCGALSETNLELKGCHDLLVLSQPAAIASIHRQYIEVDADIITTNTFNANAISLADYGIASKVSVINRTAARLARSVADEYMQSSSRRIWVAGSCGPTNHAASLSSDVADPSKRNINFDTLSDAYYEQIEALAESGVDLILIETVFDTLNLKAALNGASRAFNRLNRHLPIMISVTVSDKGGHTLSGQTIDALIASVGKHEDVLSIGLNCSFGPKDIIPHLRHLAAVSPYPVSCHPNAGLPDELGNYRETPESFVNTLIPVLQEGTLNIVGGCCGTTPDHIRQLAGECRDIAVPHVPAADNHESLRLSGLELFDSDNTDFVVVGERCNVAGSRKFLRLINEGNYDEATRIAAQQIASGADIIDINMDDPLLDAPVVITKFLNIISSDPLIAKVPVMIDSSNWEVVETALKCLQGRSVVNSISLKEGESEFVRKAIRIRELGAAVVVMAFDEEGQADTFERKCEICERAYKLLTEKVGFVGGDIIFDPNIMAIATGVEEHNQYALEFIRATEWIKQHLPGAKVSGGVSNLSFSFRGNNQLREAMHSVFLHHARRAGMDMAIVNPVSLIDYESIDPELRNLLDDVILARRPEAPAELADVAVEIAEKTGKNTVSKTLQNQTYEWRNGSIADKLIYSIINGVSTYLKEDVGDALATGMKPSDIINGPLMTGMEEVGRLFGEGRMFLPQVVKTARTMKDAVAILRPVMESEKAEDTQSAPTGKVLIATVKGDVHDIGKNIVSIVLECNNFEVIDLGVMVPVEVIIEEARRMHPDIIALSGLITPSLGEMAKVAAALQNKRFDIPLIVGGAATSALHTMLKIAPVYSAPVVHAKDASQNPVIIAKLLNPNLRDKFLAKLADYNAGLIANHTNKTELLPWSQLKDKQHPANDYKPLAPSSEIGKILKIDIRMGDVLPLINWKYFVKAWRIAGDSFEQGKLIADAKSLLESISSESVVARTLVRFDTANSDGNDIVLHSASNLRLPMLRNQHSETAAAALSLADFILPAESEETDYIGSFCVSVLPDALGPESSDEYNTLLQKTLSDRLAEAASEWLHREVRCNLWGYAPNEVLTDEEVLHEKFTGIRPAIGYPSLPDQLLMHELPKILPVGEIGIAITENGAMSPTSSVSGFYIANHSAHYFTIEIDETQLIDYSNRRNLPLEKLRPALLKIIR